MFPERFVNLGEARRRYGDRVDRMGALLGVGDDLADAASAALTQLPGPQRDALLERTLSNPSGPREGAPKALEALLDHVAHVPFWVDFERVERGGAALLRTGIWGGIVLGFRSLILGYCSPGGNKPLMFSGRLRENASRRVSETGRFVQAVCLPGGMRRGGEGFAMTVKVRLMHAQVRRLLASSPKWKSAQWGVPINQVDMAGTALLFSLIVADGVRMLGVKLDAGELEDLLHLWRYVGYVMGVQEELLAASEPEARRYWGLLEATQARPDADSGELARALLESSVTDAPTPEEAAKAARFIPVVYGISRFLVGDRFADELGFPKNVWRFAAPAIRSLVSGGNLLLKRVPGGDRLMLEAGLAYWQRVLRIGLGSEDARFEMPERVGNA